jgi:hypothetical protein
MFKTFRVLLFAACLLGFAGTVSAGPIVNGSFEDPNLGGNWSYIYTSIPGWASTSHAIEIGAGSIYGVTGYDGNQVLELDSDGNSVVGQAVTTPGGFYTLSFLYAMRSGTSQATNTFEVYWNGSLLASLSPSSSEMTLYSITVVASTAGLDSISFKGTGTEDTYGGIIDNVQLQSVPDGGTTVALFGLALAGLGALKRRLG